MGPTSGARSISPAPHLTLATASSLGVPGGARGPTPGAQRLQSEASCLPLPTYLPPLRARAPSLLGPSQAAVSCLGPDKPPQGVGGVGSIITFSSVRSMGTIVNTQRASAMGPGPWAVITHRPRRPLAWLPRPRRRAPWRRAGAGDTRRLPGSRCGCRLDAIRAPRLPPLPPTPASPAPGSCASPGGLRAPLPLSPVETLS